MSNVYEQRLKEMESHWVQDSQKGFTNLPDGVYLCKLQDIRLEESNNTGNLQIVSEWLVFDTENSGDVIYIYTPIEGEYGPSLTRQFIESLNYEFPNDPEKIPDIINDLLNVTPAVRIKLTTKKERQNKKILAVIDDSELPLSSDSAFSKEDEDVEEPELNNNEEEEETNNDSTWREGERCLVDYDGTAFAGTITSINQEYETAVIYFDDETQAEHAFSEMVEIEEETNDDDFALFSSLQALAIAYGLQADIRNCKTLAEITSALSNTKWKEENLDQNEIELLKSVNITTIPTVSQSKSTVKKSVTKKKAVTEEPVIFNFEDVIQFLKRKGITVPRERSKKALFERLDEYEWDATASDHEGNLILSSDEINILKSVGITVINCD